MEAIPSILEPLPAPFDAWAEKYDEAFTESRVGLAQRASVRREMDKQFRSGQRILEINCGTGVDALHLAQHGVQVLACDASRKMINVALRRISLARLEASVNLCVLPTERLRSIAGTAVFDGGLSNFAGLNCVEDVSKVGKELARLLKPRAKLLTCLFGRWCLWEMVWYLAKGNLGKAFRRVREQSATVGSNACNFRVYYPSVWSLEQAFAPFFRLNSWKGVGIAVPPSYLEPLAIRFRRAFRVAEFLDRGLSGLPIVRGIADHLLLTFERIGD